MTTSSMITSSSLSTPIESGAVGFSSSDSLSVSAQSSSLQSRSTLDTGVISSTTSAASAIIATPVANSSPSISSAILIDSVASSSRSAILHGEISISPEELAQCFATLRKIELIFGDFYNSNFPNGISNSNLMNDRPRESSNLRELIEKQRREIEIQRQVIEKMNSK